VDWIAGAYPLIGIGQVGKCGNYREGILVEKREICSSPCEGKRKLDALNLKLKFLVSRFMAEERQKPRFEPSARFVWAINCGLWAVGCGLPL